MSNIWSGKHTQFNFYSLCKHRNQITMYMKKNCVFILDNDLQPTVINILLLGFP